MDILGNARIFFFLILWFFMSLSLPKFICQAWQADFLNQTTWTKVQPSNPNLD